MKNYLTFYGDCYYPCGGMKDFIGDFDTIEQAKEAITMAHLINRPEDKEFEWAWASIWSIIDRLEVFSKNRD